MASNVGAHVLTKRHVFGCAKGSGVHCFDDKHICYQSGHCMVVANALKRKQKFINPTKNAKQKKIVFSRLSRDKKLLALAEEDVLTIFLTNSLRKRKILPSPQMEKSEQTKIERFLDADWTPTNELITLHCDSQMQHYFLSSWAWENGAFSFNESLIQYLQPEQGPVGSIKKFAVSESVAECGSVDIAVIGPNFFQVFQHTKTKFIAYKCESSYGMSEYIEILGEQPTWTDVAWLQQDLVLANEQGDLLTVSDDEGFSFIVKNCGKKSNQGIEVVNIVNEKMLILGLVDGSVCIYTRTSLRTKEWNLWGRHQLMHEPVESLAISPSMDKIYAQVHQQIFCVDTEKLGIEPNVMQEELAAKILFNDNHVGEVTGMDACIRKQLIVTSGSDRTIRIWNYLEKKLVFMKKFHERIHSVAFHPSGFHLLVGFADKLRLLNVLSDDLQAYKEFPSIRACPECHFSNGGHIFAAAHNDKVYIYNTYNGQQIQILKAHSQKVQSIFFTADDAHCITAGLDGSVFQWSISTAERVSEFANRQIPIEAAVFTVDNKLIVAGLNGEIREIAEGQLENNVKVGLAITELCLGHGSPQSLLVCGTSLGLVRTLVHPNLVENVKDYVAHEGKISRVRITHDDSYLFTCGLDGAVIVFEIKEKEGRINPKAEFFQFSEEVLVTTTGLEEMEDRQVELKAKADELKLQSEFQLRFRDVHFQDAVKEKTDDFNKQYQNLRQKYDALKDEIQDLELEFEERIRMQRDTYAEEVQKLEADHQKDLMQEVDKYFKLKETLKEEERQWEERTIQHQDAHSERLDQIQSRHSGGLAKSYELTSDQQEVFDRLQREYDETRTQLLEDLDTEILEIKEKYQGMLSEEKSQALQLKGENGVMKKKFVALQNEIDELKEKAKEISVHESERKKIIQTRTDEISRFEAEMKELDTLIGEKEKKIFDLKKKNQNLEKHKFVFDHKIKDLKRQLEPRDIRIADIKAEVMKLDSELQKRHGHKRGLQKEIKVFVKEHEAMKGKLQSHQKTIQVLNRKMTEFSYDLNQTITYILLPNKLKAGVKQLLSKHIGAHSEQSEKNDDEILSKEFLEEYQFQEDYLKQQIKKTQREAAVQEKNIFEKELSMLKENQELIEEIKGLRTHLNDIRIKRSKKLLEVGTGEV